MMKYEEAFEHIHGIPHDDSRDEMHLFRDIVNNMRVCEDPKYEFYFNYPITFFGVPSKTFRIQDYRENFIAYIMGRSLIDRSRAIEIMNLITTPVRTNALELDIGKTDRDGNLVVALESNRDSHYRVPDDYKRWCEFAKGVFNDMIKEMELRKIASFMTIDHRIMETCGTCSNEHFNQIMAVRDFVSNI